MGKKRAKQAKPKKAQATKPAKKATKQKPAAASGKTQVTLDELVAELHELANPEIAEHSQRFFKTGPGEYGEGDLFLGIRVGHLRTLSKKGRHLELKDLVNMLQSGWHEQRLLALLSLVLKYEKADDAGKQEIYDAYMQNLSWVNNWDLVDSSAHAIVGPHLFGKSQKPLEKLAKSPNLWFRRVSVITTYYYIKQDHFDMTLSLSEKLLADQEDLIHKAVGWMLREMGKRDEAPLHAFLEAHADVMPRTMLRYAIERLPEAQRQAYLQRG